MRAQKLAAVKLEQHIWRRKGPSWRAIWLMVGALGATLVVRLALVQTVMIDLDPKTMRASVNGVPLAELASPVHMNGRDPWADPVEFVRLRHFQAEVHTVITRDNYILTLHRVVNPLVPSHLRSRLKPALLQPGLLTSAFNFLVGSDARLDRPRFDARDLVRTWPLSVYTPQPPFSWPRLLESLNDLTLARLRLASSSDRLHQAHTSDSLALEMANQGYDVWLGNSRGTTFCLNHTTLDYRRDARYWDFSFHEMGLYDVPAQIDYILGLRAKRSLVYMGHSQGNLAMFVLQSLQPEWRHKVKPFVALSPVAYVPQIYYGLVRLLVRLIESTLITTTQLNRLLKGRVLFNDPAMGRALDLICLPRWTSPICSLMLTLITGDNFFRSNGSRIHTIWHHIPEGTSILNALHFAQLVASAQFRAFDFGPQQNMARYGQPEAPFYPLERIRSPDIAFVVGRTDLLSAPANVQMIRDKLSVRLIDDHQVPELFWGHADHFYASGAGRVVGAHIIGLADRYRLVDA